MSLVWINEDFSLVLAYRDGRTETVRLFGVFLPDPESNEGERAKALMKQAFDKPFIRISEQVPESAGYPTGVYVDVFEALDTSGPLWLDLGEDLIRQGLGTVDIRSTFSRRERYLEIASVETEAVKLVEVRDDLRVVVRNVKLETKTVELVGITLPRPGSEAAERARRIIRGGFESRVVSIVRAKPPHNDSPEMVYLDCLIAHDRSGDWWQDMGVRLIERGVAEVDMSQSFWRKQRYREAARKRDERKARSDGP